MANEIRFKRSKLKKEIKAGHTRVADLLLDPPGYIESMTIHDLLEAQDRWGHTRVNRFLWAVNISGTKAIASLTQRQRELMARKLNVI